MTPAGSFDDAIGAARDDLKRRVTLTLRETVAAPEVAKFIASEGPLPGDGQPYDILVDLRLAHIGVDTSAHAQTLALLASRSDPGRRSGRIAVVAADDATFGIARMYVAYRETSGITLEVFRQIEDADTWLTMARATPS